MADCSLNSELVSLITQKISLIEAVGNLVLNVREPAALELFDCRDRAQY